MFVQRPSLPREFRSQSADFSLFGVDLGDFACCSGSSEVRTRMAPLPGADSDFGHWSNNVSPYGFRRRGAAGIIAVSPMKPKPRAFRPGHGLREINAATEKRGLVGVNLAQPAHDDTSKDSSPENALARWEELEQKWLILGKATVPESPRTLHETPQTSAPDTPQHAMAPPSSPHGTKPPPSSPNGGRCSLGESPERRNSMPRVLPHQPSPAAVRTNAAAAASPLPFFHDRGYVLVEGSASPEERSDAPPPALRRSCDPLVCGGAPFVSS
jgi:hypothetical protein